MKPTKQKIQFIFIGIFLGFLLCPILGFMGQSIGIKWHEKLAYKPMPTFEWTEDYVDSFKDYIEENYITKKIYIGIGAHVKKDLFNAEPNPQKVKIGPHGWFFYNNASDDILASYSHKNLIDEEKIDSTIQNWEERTHYIQSYGGQYVHAIWPNKATVYPQELPKVMQIQIRDTLSKLDQFVSKIKKSALDTVFLDMRPVLMETSKKRTVYHKLDTHWNDNGAYIAYTAIMKKLGIKPFGIDAFEIKNKTNYEGDLVRMSGLYYQKYYSELDPHYRLLDSLNLPTKCKGTWSGSTIYTNPYATSSLSVVIFGDSFTKALVPFISLHFKKVNFEWAPYNQKYVNSQKPDIVIRCQVERYL